MLAILLPLGLGVNSIAFLIQGHKIAQAISLIRLMLFAQFPLNPLKDNIECLPLPATGGLVPRRLLLLLVVLLGFIGKSLDFVFGFEHYQTLVALLLVVGFRVFDFADELELVVWIRTLSTMRGAVFGLRTEGFLQLGLFGLTWNTPIRSRFERHVDMLIFTSHDRILYKSSI